MDSLREKQLNSPYNAEPVYYCKSCLSLAIQIIGNPEDDYSMCTHCNRTDMGITDIFTWRKMWKEKYGKYPEEKETRKTRF